MRSRRITSMAPWTRSRPRQSSRSRASHVDDDALGERVASTTKRRPDRRSRRCRRPGRLARRRTAYLSSTISAASPGASALARARLRAGWRARCRRPRRGRSPGRRRHRTPCASSAIGAAERVPRVVLDGRAGALALARPSRLSNASTSTSTLFSAAISAVSSNGNPYVSCSMKATSPSSTLRASRLGSSPRENGPFWQRRAEALLLAGDDLLDELAVLDDLGIGVAHRARSYGLDEANEERVSTPRMPAMAHGSAKQTAQHVAAALVARDRRRRRSGTSSARAWSARMRSETSRLLVVGRSRPR